MQKGSINRKQTIEFLDKDLEFLAGTGAGEGRENNKRLLKEQLFLNSKITTDECLRVNYFITPLT